MLELQLVTTDAVRTLYDAAKLHPGNLTSQEVVSIRDTYLFHGLFFYYLGMVLERVDTFSQGDFNATFFMALTVFAEDCYGTMPALVFETVEAEFIAQENNAALARFLRHLG